MRRTIYTVIFCIIFHSGFSHLDSELMEDSTDEENIIKMNETLNKNASEETIGTDDHYFSSAELKKVKEAGDAADFFGTNQHYNIPVNFPNIFGNRRFVLTYPYIQKNIVNDAAEAELDNIVKKYLESKKTSREDKELRLVKAPPEFVLQIAKLSALLEASKPNNPTNEFIEKDILRTGEYWDDVWKEDVDVKLILRSNSNKQNQLNSIKVKIPPGSKLHTLISKLKDSSPRFVYVINKNVESCCLDFFNYLTAISPRLFASMFAVNLSSSQTISSSLLISTDVLRM